MYTAIRRSLDKRNRDDKGFTLIELLVVIIIIGILAAIAIPIFLNQRKKAVDASLKSDVRTVATALETAFTDVNAYPTVVTGTLPTLTISGETVRVSPNNTVVIKSNGTATVPATAFCVAVTNPSGSLPTAVWQSDQGGLQANTVTSCSATTYPLALFTS